MTSPPVALLVTEDTALVTRVTPGLVAQGFMVEHAGSAEAARARLVEPGVAAIVVAEELPDDDGASLAIEVRAAHPASLVALWVKSASPHGDPLAEGLDEVFGTTGAPEELGWRLRLRAAELRRAGTARRRERFLRAVVRLVDLMSPFADVPSLCAAITPGLLGLPGTVGVRVWLEAETIGDPPVVVIEAGRLASGKASVVEVALRGVEGAVELNMEGTAELDEDVREALGALVGAALSGARQFGALKERQLRLERGYVDRHRKLSRVSARLERLSDARDSFLALLSHDLRSPLAVVLGQMQLLEEGLVPAAHVAKSAATVRWQAERMVQMVEDLLDRYRRDDAVRALPEVGDAVRIVNEMVDAARPLAASRRQELVQEGVAAAPIDADLASIREVLANLLENALRHSPDGSRVVVNVGVDDRSVLIGVEDSGPGFGSAAARGGSGLSIAIRASARIAADAGGALRTANVAGGGGLATLVLPLAVPQLTASAVDLYAPEGSAGAALAPVLANHWELRIFSDTSGAVERMRRQPPALVVIDQGADGQAVAFVRRIKNDTQLAAVPVIAVADDGPAFYEAGALAVLRAPVPAALALAHVRRALRVVGDAPSTDDPPPDVLTGLPSGAALTRRLDRALAEARADGLPLPVLVVRIEELKQVNRQHGWLVGDQLILWVAARLAERLHAGEMLARVDAESFALAAPARSLAEAQVLATETRDALNRSRPRLGVARVDVRVSAQAFDLTTLALGGGTPTGAGRDDGDV
jgi:diguanylate cyclase (GGDEF)-like protein